MNWISVAMNATSTNVSLYCTASKRTLPQWRMMSADPPGIMFVEFFCERYLPAMDNGNTRPHRVQIKHLMRNLKSMNCGLTIVLRSQMLVFRLRVWLCKTTTTKHLMMSQQWYHAWIEKHDSEQCCTCS